MTANETPAVLDAGRITRTYMVLSGTYTLAASLIWSVNTLFLLEAGLDIQQVFIANAFYSAGMVLFEIPTGVVADTLGRRVSYLASVGVLSASTAAYLWASSAGQPLWVFCAVSVAMGLGFTFYSGALEAWLVDGLAAAGSHKALDRVLARGQQVSGAAMLIGTIGGGLLGQASLAFPYVGRCVVLVAVFGFAFGSMRDIGFTPQPLGLGEIPRRMREQARVGVARGWRQPGIRLLMIASALQGVFLGWGFYAAQPYFLELLHRDAVWVVGLVTAGFSLATIAGNEAVELLSKRVAKRSTLLIAASVISAAGAILIGLTSSFVVAVAGLLGVALAMGVLSPIRQAYIHQVTDSEYRATVLSFDSMVTSVGGIGGQAGLGAVSKAQSFGAGYLIGGSISALALPVMLAVRRLGGPSDDLPTQ